MWQAEENTLHKSITIMQEKDTLKILQKAFARDVEKEKQTEVLSSVVFVEQNRKNSEEERGKRMA